MKIEFLTQDDPLYVLPFFEEFFKACPAEIEVLAVSSSRAMGKRPRKQLFQELVSLYGPAGSIRIAARLARARLFNLISRKRGADRYDTLAQLCRSYGVSYTAIGTPNAPEFLQGVRHRAPVLQPAHQPEPASVRPAPGLPGWNGRRTAAGGAAPACPRR